MAELKPCPFCGGEIVYAEIYPPLSEFRIYCEECAAEMRLSFDDAGIVSRRIDFEKAQTIMEQMTEAWNRRAGDGNAD